MFHYLTETPENVRSSAVSKFSEGSERLRQEIEKRRKRNSNESLSMRRKIYSAQLVANELDRIRSFLPKAGLSEHDETEVLSKNARSIVSGCPTYYIEREIALRLEAQSRPIEENDLRDMQSFCAVLAYADIVVAENTFSNLAIQARLDQKYGTRIMTNLLDLPGALRSAL